MPRKARIKCENGKYHIIVRSISDVLLFRQNTDKSLYMSTIKHYQKLYLFKVYAYCLMDNHAHLIIDSNGADISKIMHCINFRYVQKFNKKYNRHGHLLQDRFKSKLITSEKYLFTLSAYIHNNPIDIKKYSNCPEKYKYSSLAVYIGLRKDPYNILDEDFIMQMFGTNVKRSRHNYIRFVYKCDTDKFSKKDIEFLDDKTEYKSNSRLLHRNFKSDDILDFISNKTKINKIKFHIKYNRETTIPRALTVILLRCFCNYRCKDICSTLGNLTQASVSRLSSLGLKLITENPKYKHLPEEFLYQYSL